MHRHVHALSAVTIAMVTAFGVSGCGTGTSPSPPAGERVPASASPSADAGTAAPLPPPEALTDVLYRLADTSIPAERKLALVQYSTPEDEEALGNFGHALSDGGFRDLTIEASEVGWAPTPGNVDATVRITPAADPARAFTFPMEFNPLRDGWQLTRATADQVLVLSAGAPPPNPTPPR